MGKVSYDDLPAASPLAVTRRFVEQMRHDYGALGDRLLDAFSAFLAEVPAHGRLYVDRLMHEVREPDEPTA